MEIEDQIKELERKFIELETKQKLFLEALSSLIMVVSPNHDSYAYFALIRGFTTNELESLEKLLKQVSFDMAFNNKRISKEEFKKKFDEIFPEDKYTLLSVIKALNAEGKHSYLSNLFLDNEEVNTD